jgi:hypothetical protein
MKTQNRIAIIVAVLMCTVGLALYGYYYLKHQADWDEVQKTAIRVDSGLRHETLIALRSKVADLDAVLIHYVDGSGRRQKENRVRAIQQAIEGLEWAIDHENAIPILDGSEGFAFYEKRPYLLTEPNCDESTGKLFLGSPGLAKASLTYAQSALTTPDQSPKIRTTDLRFLRTKCVADYETYTTRTTAAAEAGRIHHLRDYPLQVDVKNVGDDDVIFYCWTDDIPESNLDPHGRIYVLRKGRSQHLEAKGVITVGAEYIFSHTDPPLAFQVNGKPSSPSWTPWSGDFSYVATIRLKAQS